MYSFIKYNCVLCTVVVGTGVSECNRKTPKPVIWYLAWLILTFIGHWYLEVKTSIIIKKGLRMESEHQKTYDLLSHLTHLHWYHIVTSRGHWYLEVKTSMIIWGQKRVSEWNRNTKKPAKNTAKFVLINVHNIWFVFHTV